MATSANTSSAKALTECKLTKTEYDNMISRAAYPVARHLEDKEIDALVDDNSEKITEEMNDCGFTEDTMVELGLDEMEVFNDVIWAAQLEKAIRFLEANKKHIPAGQLQRLAGNVMSNWFSYQQERDEASGK